MSKIKMRCIACGKWFQSANAKEVTCPECTQKARKDKLATKNTPPPASLAGHRAPNPPQAPVVPKPKQTQGGTNQWLDTLEDVKVAQPDQPPVRPKIPYPPVQRDIRNEPGNFRSGPPMNGGPTSAREEHGRRAASAHSPSNYRSGSTPLRSRPSGQYSPGQHLRQPIESGPERRPHKPAFPDKPRHGPARAKTKLPKPSAPPRPKREKTPPPPPFRPTLEQIQQVEERYLELAQPAEFDGIRTQIAKEFSIPKKAVKKIVKELRERQNIPSWWELQAYKGSTEELEKIKAIYKPYLPVPPLNIHRKIAEDLAIKSSTVYQAIKTIRQELNLPQYNDPTLHAEDLTQHRQGQDTLATKQSISPTEASSTSSEV